MKPTRKDIITAAYQGRSDLLQSYAENGGDFNEIMWGETLLQDVVSDLCVDTKPYRYDIVRQLLKLGADPKMIGEEGSHALVPAMLAMDTEMLRILLETGAEPNRVRGFLDTQLLYDWAEIDYRYEIVGINPHDEATEEEKKDEDSWLRYLDRIAIKNNWRRPDHLFLLREHGARCAHEILEKTEPTAI